MDARLNHNIARIRRDIRHLSREMQSRIDADEDCTEPAQQIMRAHSDATMRRKFGTIKGRGIGSTLETSNFARNKTCWITATRFCKQVMP